MNIKIAPLWTDAENQTVLRMLAEGHTHRQIATALPGRTVGAVKIHISKHLSSQKMDTDLWKARTRYTSDRFARDGARVLLARMSA